MKKVSGITEQCWTSLTEDQRLLWKYFSRSIAILSALFISKSGSHAFDWFVVAITAIFLMLLIESQRTYSRLSPWLRKLSVRAAIFIGSWSLVALGVAIFSHAAISTVFVVFAADVFPLLQSSPHPFASLVIFGIACCAASLALFRTFRQLRIEELIYVLPRDALKELLIYKRIKATSFPMFAAYELWALVVCLVYVSSVANIAKLVIALM